MNNKILYLVFSLLFALKAFSQVDTTLDIPEVEVTAKYVSPVSVMGQMLPIRRIPLSVSVLNPIRIREMNITTLDEAMRQVIGVSTITNDNMRSRYRSRGYEMSIMYDGLPSYNSLALSHQFDLSFYEQIEILRGMSNILQGVPDGQSLGGVINLVRKKAKSKFGLSTYTSAGSWKNYRSEIDLNIPLMKNNKLRSRWVFFLNNREFFYDRSNMNKQGGYGVVEWEVTPSTLFDLSYAYQYTRSNVLYNGLPALRQT